MNVYDKVYNIIKPYDDYIYNILIESFEIYKNDLFVESKICINTNDDKSLNNMLDDFLKDIDLRIIDNTKTLYKNNYYNLYTKNIINLTYIKMLNELLHKLNLSFDTMSNMYDLYFIFKIINSKYKLHTDFEKFVNIRFLADRSTSEYLSSDMVNNNNYEKYNEEFKCYQNKQLFEESTINDILYYYTDLYVDCHHPITHNNDYIFIANTNNILERYKPSPSTSLFKINDLRHSILNMLKSNTEKTYLTYPSKIEYIKSMAYVSLFKDMIRKYRMYSVCAHLKNDYTKPKNFVISEFSHINYFLEYHNHNNNYIINAISNNELKKDHFNNYNNYVYIRYFSYFQLDVKPLYRMLEFKIFNKEDILIDNIIYNKIDGFLELPIIDIENNKAYINKFLIREQIVNNLDFKYDSMEVLNKDREIFKYEILKNGYKINIVLQKIIYRFEPLTKYINHPYITHHQDKKSKILNLL